jgi:hypothetical protein
MTLYEALVPAANIVRSIVPSPVPEYAYWAIITVGRGEISDRSIVALLVHLTGKDPGIVLNDVYKVGAGQIPPLEGLEECAGALRRAGL